VTGSIYAGTTITDATWIHGPVIPQSPVPALIEPAVGACAPYSPDAGLTGRYSYDGTTGDLSVSDGQTLTIAAGTYCFGSVTLSGNATLAVGGPVVISLTGTFSESGSSLVNQTGAPANLQISTSFTGSSGVAISGSSVAHFTVYAPAAEVVVSGGSQVSGLVLGSSIALSDSAAIHEDTTAGTAWAGYFQN
jgi:hypothetical protein